MEPARMSPTRQHVPFRTAPRTTRVARRADKPPFAELVSSRYADLPIAQRVDVLSLLLGTVGPLALGAIAGGAFVKCTARAGWNGLSVERGDAIQATPEQIRELARYAEQAEPGIVARTMAILALEPDPARANPPRPAWQPEPALSLRESLRI